MPHKFNDPRRGKFEKARYQLANPSENNESLRQRGYLTVWVSDGLAENWSPHPRCIKRITPIWQSRFASLCAPCFDFRLGKRRASCGRLPN